MLLLFFVKFLSFLFYKIFYILNIIYKKDTKMNQKTTTNKQTLVTIHTSYWTFCCIVSLSIFTSCAVFWRARRASQNTNNE